MQDFFNSEEILIGIIIVCAGLLLLLFMQGDQIWFLNYNYKLRTKEWERQKKINTEIELYNLAQKKNIGF